MENIGASAKKRANLNVNIEILLSKAKAGDPSAQYVVGSYYLLGLGVKRDAEQAFTWFLRSAKRCHLHAQAHLGNIYARVILS